MGVRSHTYVESWEYEIKAGYHFGSPAILSQIDPEEEPGLSDQLDLKGKESPACEWYPVPRAAFVSLNNPEEEPLLWEHQDLEEIELPE
ncbi:hypothetical protein KIL84_012035, partial [Mauremys mutica]